MRKNNRVSQDKQWHAIEYMHLSNSSDTLHTSLANSKHVLTPTNFTASEHSGARTAGKTAETAM